MRRYNQRLYRITLAILRNDAEAEDVMQDAYVRAYQHLDQFGGHAPFSAWLTRIAVNEALARLRLRKRNPQLDDSDPDGETTMNMVETAPNPEQSATRAELGRLLEEALLDLPEQYRTVVMLRDIEELSTAETAAALDLTGVAERIRLPFLVVFGKQDRLIPYQHAERLFGEISSADKQLEMYEHGNHVVNNIPYAYRPLVADWVADHLRARSTTSS